MSESKLDKDLEWVYEELLGGEPEDEGLRDDHISILIDEIQSLRDAVRKHRDEKHHDRCWLDDLELYKKLPEGLDKVDQQLPPEKEFLDNCKRYYDHRQNPNIVFIRQKETDIEHVITRGYEVVSTCGIIVVRPLENGKYAVDIMDTSNDPNMSGCIDIEEVFTTAKEAVVRFIALEKKVD